jgi:hypothetical protein
MYVIIKKAKKEECEKAIEVKNGDEVCGGGD